MFLNGTSEACRHTGFTYLLVLSLVIRIKLFIFARGLTKVHPIKIRHYLPNKLLLLT